MNQRDKDQNKTSVLRIKHFMFSLVQEEKMQNKRRNKKKERL